jgi:hypothetical protein
MQMMRCALRPEHTGRTVFAFGGIGQRAGQAAAQARTEADAVSSDAFSCAVASPCAAQRLWRVVHRHHRVRGHSIALRVLLSVPH